MLIWLLAAVKNKTKMPSDKDKVSVALAMPVLNAERYLEHTLETIIAQNYEDWRLSITDGGSTDSTLQILHHYAKHDSRIQIQVIPQSGLYHALNESIYASSSEFIGFAMADDPWHKTMLERGISELQAHPDCGLCQFPLTQIDSENNETQFSWNKCQLSNYLGEAFDKKHVRKAPLDGILHSTLRSLSISLTQLLVRRSLVEKIGGFRTDIGHQADFEWAARAGFNTNVLYIPYGTAYWRRHQNQVTNYIEDEDQFRRFMSNYQLAIKAFVSSDYSSEQKNRLLFPYWFLAFFSALNNSTKLGKFSVFFKYFAEKPGWTLEALKYRFNKTEYPISQLRKIVKSMNLDKHLTVE